MELYGVNLVGVLVAAVVGMLFGFIWYSPKVFGVKWMKLAGISKRKAKEAKEKGMFLNMLGGFIGQIVTAAVLSVFLLYAGAGSIAASLVVAFLLWLGFTATTQIGLVLWEQKPWGLFALNGLYSLCNLLIMAIVLQLLA
ncbi:hypothetical protein CL619_02840 [archaeon]|nr:hypothetical protein [archaeon]